MTPDRKSVRGIFQTLPQPADRVQCMHVYIDGSLRNFRTKDRTWPSIPKCPSEFEPLEFCGSATDFDVGNEADYYARPVRLYRDPCRGGPNTIVFCDTYNNRGLPTFANNRYRLLAADVGQSESVYTFQQPFTLLRQDGTTLSRLDPQDSECHFTCGREVSEAHYRACLYAGVNQSSLEPINNKGQWRYSVSGTSLLALCDDVWVSRFLLQRVAEDFGVAVSLDSNPRPRVLQSVSASLHVQRAKSEADSLANSLAAKLAVQEEVVAKIANGVAHSGLPADTDPYSVGVKILEATKLTAL